MSNSVAVMLPDFHPRDLGNGLRQVVAVLRVAAARNEFSVDCADREIHPAYAVALDLIDGLHQAAEAEIQKADEMRRVALKKLAAARAEKSA